ncbi:uncharacterized protein METZ01_LOCUS308560, partial [marine metagenome]
MKDATIQSHLNRECVGFSSDSSIFS